MTDAEPRRSVANALARPVDVSWLAALRVLLGAVLCVSMLRLLAYGWIERLFLNPFQFKYWGFAWVAPLPAPLLHALVVVLAAAAAAMSAGLAFRASSAIFLVGFAYLQLLDVTNYLNHYYLAALLVALLAASPAGRSFSLDRRLGRAPAADAIPAFWLYLFRWQVGVVYTFAGLAKAHGDWLLHSQPLRIWLASKTDLPIVGPLLAHDLVPPLFSWAGFAFDSTIIWFLLWRRTRPAAFCAVLAFHATTRALFPIGMFPFIMVVAALVMFPPDWPRRLAALAGDLRRRSRRATRASSTGDTNEPTVRPVHPIGVAAAACYCALQLALPLRHLAYPGDVRWHEQGMRFSWRVMVREKNGSITFVVREQRTGRVSHVPPRQYLTRVQEREMGSQPDLILQLARHVRSDFERRGLGPVEVRVDAVASLNGRRAHRLIDASVDLGAERDGLHPARWILVGPSEPPPLRPQRESVAHASR